MQMAPDTVEKYEEAHGRYVEAVTIIRTDSWNIRAGSSTGSTTGRSAVTRFCGTTIVTNGRKATSGTPDGTEIIEFHGMSDRYDRFLHEIDDLPPDHRGGNTQ